MHNIYHIMLEQHDHNDEQSHPPLILIKNLQQSVLLVPSLTVIVVDQKIVPMRAYIHPITASSMRLIY